MGTALKKTMDFLGFRDPAKDEVEDYEIDDYQDDDLEHIANFSRPELVEEHPVDLRRILTVRPTTYNGALSIGESFRDGTPVILNLTEMSEEEARRMVDFSAGLVFALHGKIERVTNRVFLLSPAHVEVVGKSSAKARGSFFNQS